MDAGVGSANQSAAQDTQNLQPLRHKPSPRTSDVHREPSGSEHTESSKNPRRSNDPNPVQSTRNTQTASEKPRPVRHGRRGVKFNATLSTSQPSSTTTTSRKGNAVERKGDDLTSTLIHTLSTPPYPDCPICFNAIQPDQQTWSCSPSLSSSDKSDRNLTTQCCWTTFHLHCIRSWSTKSVKEVADAWRARGEERTSQWRCPGCQLKREIVPNGYWYDLNLFFLSPFNSPFPLGASVVLLQNQN
jgi:transcriptional repressor NF-X1